jgi:hypothetical protein
MKTRTVLIEVACGDSKELTQAQTKLNQWSTIGLLIKYDMVASATHYLFRVLLKKEGE